MKKTFFRNLFVSSGRQQNAPRQISASPFVFKNLKLEKNNSTKNLMVLNFNEIKKRLIFYANTKKKLLQVTQF
jgi:hypothetical protein